MSSTQRPRSAPQAVAAALASLGLLAGCGGEVSDTADSSASSAASSAATSAEVVVELDPTADDERHDAGASVLAERVELLGVPATIDRVGPTVTLVVDRADEPLVRAALDGDGIVEFRPVLAPPDPDGATLSAPEQVGGTDQVVLADAEGTAYRLGPGRLGADGIEGVTVRLGPAEQWQLEPVLAAGAEGIEAFNALAAQCFAGAAECPDVGSGGRGLIAIVVDGTVLSAPQVNVPVVERNQIRISGDFSETEARVLAARMGAGERSVAWTVED